MDACPALCSPPGVDTRAMPVAISTAPCHGVSHQEHLEAEQIANALADRLEAVEKDKEAQLRRLQAQKKEVERYGNIYEDLKRELDIVQASAGAV